MLNVKLRSSQTRAARIRLAGLGLSVTVALVVVLFLLWRGGEWALDCLVYKNEAFAIQKIDVQTDGVIAPENIRRWALVKPRENLLALDLARIKRDLELVPWIQSAAVERVLPRTLRLQITEREPVAKVLTTQMTSRGDSESVIYQLDETGYLMLPLDPRLRAASPTLTNDSLPIISGINASDLRPGRRVESPQVLAALNLITAFDRSPMVGLAELERINVAAPEVLEVITSHASQVTFSLSGFETQLNRWRLVYDQYQKLGRAIATLDLSIANNVPLRFVEANPVPLPEKKVKPSRPRKKNV